ncbi:MAG: hypothetical protein DMD49_02015 [Gemmatimonadetes bacterium]|nr:MAG: hypothetical protein DMD49_02015 [Gemmatimonadota bacterium]
MATSSHQRLRSSLLLAGVAAAVSLAVGVALVGGQNARGTLERLANARGREIATRVATLASSYMRERRHEVDVLARSPLVVTAARDAASADPQLAVFLRDYPQRSDIAELVLTNSHGVGVVASTGRLGLGTYQQEVWWQAALRDGAFEGYSPGDSSRSGSAVEYAVAVRAPGAARPAGVLRAGVALDRLGQLLATSDLGDGAYLELVDDMGHVIATPNRAQPEPGAQEQAIPREERPVTLVVRTSRGPELVVSAPANQGKWWVLFRQPTSRAYAAVQSTLHTIWLGAAALLVLALLLVWRLGTWVTERVTGAGRGGGSESHDGWRSLGHRRDAPHRVERGGRPAVLGSLDGGCAAAPRRGDPGRGGRGSCDGGADLGVDRADERLHPGDVRDLPGSVAPRRGAGPAGPCGGGRHGEDPANPHHPRRGR